jgi:hypothetical protein
MPNSISWRYYTPNDERDLVFDHPPPPPPVSIVCSLGRNQTRRPLGLRVRILQTDQRYCHSPSLILKKSTNMMGDLRKVNQTVPRCSRRSNRYRRHFSRCTNHAALSRDNPLHSHPVGFPEPRLKPFHRRLRSQHSRIQSGQEQVRSRTSNSSAGSHIVCASVVEVGLARSVRSLLYPAFIVSPPTESFDCLSKSCSSAAASKEALGKRFRSQP